MGQDANTHSDPKRRAPAAERNIAPILDVLKDRLPTSGVVLEIASGTGQHAAAFACAFPNIDWCPSDRAADARSSIAAWRMDAGASNLRTPLDIDVLRRGWFDEVEGPFDAVIAINLVHVAPWSAAEGLLKGASELLAPRGMVYLYGPYRRDGEHTAESNVRFESWLHAQDPEWGVRDVQEIERAGTVCGLKLEDAIEMPANNFSLILRKTKTQP